MVVLSLQIFLRVRVTLASGIWSLFCHMAFLVVITTIKKMWFIGLRSISLWFIYSRVTYLLVIGLNDTRSPLSMVITALVLNRSLAVSLSLTHMAIQRLFLFNISRSSSLDWNFVKNSIAFLILSILVLFLVWLQYMARTFLLLLDSLYHYSTVLLKIFLSPQNSG